MTDLARGTGAQYLEVLEAHNGELLAVQWRRKVPAMHGLADWEVSALNKLRKRNKDAVYVFTSERGSRMTTGNIQKMVARAGRAAGFEKRIHPHQLRHAAGWKLANDGVDVLTIQAYLGHANVNNTLIYTKVAGSRVKSAWRD